MLLFFFFFWQVEYPNQKLWLSVRLEYRMALEVPNFWFHDEGPKGRPERGEWEPIKISCNRKDRLSPKRTTNFWSPR